MRLDNINGIKRLVIYFFYDKDGIVDRYVTYMLDEMKRNSSEIFIVCNGKLTPEGRKKFTDITPATNILVRDNEGFDVWAYKESLEHYGWKKLSQFDEVVLMNSTIMGPVYPFKEMFDEMNTRDLDFWGITAFHRVDANPYNVKYGYVPKHIQSHFIAVRKAMLESVEFHKYWDNHEKVESYGDAVGKHEAIFTKMFADKGFKWEVYVDTSDLEKFVHYPLSFSPTLLLKEYKCPIFKRRSFFNPYTDYLCFTNGDPASELMDYLKNNTDYDVDMIWENIIRLYNMSDIKKCLHLNYILEDNYSEPIPQNTKVALVIHLYFDDLIEYCFAYALSMPENCDLYITTDTEDKKKRIEKIFNKGSWKNIKIIKVENHGRDVSALVVGVAEYMLNYDYVCFVHDKKVTQLDYGIKGHAFSEHCFQNVLGSRHLVNNIINKFESEPRLGLLCPSTPNIAEYYSTLGCEWGLNYYNTKKLADELELNCPIDSDKEPISPYGTMFWFRTVALEKLFRGNWKYKDFPEEPNNTDGTILHAFERIYTFIAQDAGYYSAWVFSKRNACNEITNLTFMLREINIRAFQIYGINYFYGLINVMEYYRDINNGVSSNNLPIASERKIIKQIVKKKIPNPIWAFFRKIYHFFGGKKWVG